MDNNKLPYCTSLVSWSEPGHVSVCMGCCALPRCAFPVFLKSQGHTSARMSCCAHPHCIFSTSSMEHSRAGEPNLLSFFHKDYFPLVLQLARSFYLYHFARARAKFYGHAKTTFELTLRSVNSFDAKSNEK